MIDVGSAARSRSATAAEAASTDDRSQYWGFLAACLLPSTPRWPMDVEVLSKIRTAALTRSLAARAWPATACCCGCAAPRSPCSAASPRVGLGLVALLSQHRLAAASLSGPLPGAPTARPAAVHDAIALTHAGSRRDRRRGGRRSLGAPAAGAREAAPAAGAPARRRLGVGQVRSQVAASPARIRARREQPTASQPAPRRRRRRPSPARRRRRPAVASSRAGATAGRRSPPQPTRRRRGQGRQRQRQVDRPIATESQVRPSRRPTATAGSSPSKAVEEPKRRTRRQRRRSRATAPPPPAAPEKSGRRPSPAAAKEAADAAKAGQAAH